ncbi:FAD dependent oxidoreductase [Armillaria solidipes]|uniref:FAD dependent oxidoreductase n=1 Tax=Armillaria solidipes TaxID=1076256 RepID=A0A2H3BSX3_9AGAR|nr:FAD dependent oxidoreductase [Armillaria solidipes]
MASLQDKKVIIVGGAVAGLSTSLHLARSGVDVTVLDYQPYEENGYAPSKGCDAPSADVNKVFRCWYGKETEYQRLAFAAREEWFQWNKDIAATPTEDLPPSLTPNTQLLYLSGVLRLPSTESSPLSKFDLDSLATLTPEQKSHAHILSEGGDLGGESRRVRAVNWNGDGILDLNGGFTRADKACAYAKYLAGKAGVKFILGPEKGKVVEIIKEDKDGEKKATGVKTKDGVVHTGDLIIVAAGGWTPSLLPETADRLETTAGSVMLYQFPPKEQEPELWSKYSPENFLVWAWGLSGSSPIGNVYGFPITEDGLFKVGYRGLKYTNFADHPSEPGLRISVPKTRYTEIKETRIPLVSVELIKDTLRKLFPDIAEKATVASTRLCWYCDSLDNNFLIDYVPGYGKSLFVVSGGSGHMFKFLPNLGEKVIDVLLEKETEYTKLWKWPQPDKERIPWIEKTNGLQEGELGPRVLRKVVLAEEPDLAN